MSLRGQTVRIMYNKPCDREENIFGAILSNRGADKILVELKQPIKGKKRTIT
jgi:hypothetical protein